MDVLDRTQRLLDINVNPNGSPVIPLSTVATVRRLEGPSEIRRVDGQLTLRRLEQERWPVPGHTRNRAGDLARPRARRKG